MLTPRRAIVPLLAAVAAAAGCGQDPAAEGPLAAAAERTANEASYRFAFEADIDTENLGEFHLDGTGTATADNERGRLDLTFEEPGGDPLRMDMINIRDEFWIRSPEIPLPAGKRWMHSVDEEVAPSTMTTREFLVLIRESGEVEEVGAERVRGRATTHYKAKVTLGDVYERSPEETRERFREQFRQIDEDLEMPIEVWIDGEDLVRRMVVALEHEGESFTIRSDLIAFGVPVDTDPPPAEQVIEESEVLPDG